MKTHPDTLFAFADLSPYRRVYLAGPMRGKTRSDMADNFAAFGKATSYLRGDLGLQVFDPAERDQVDNGFRPGDEDDPVQCIEVYMADDLPEVCRAEAVVVLPGWENSQGARTEALVAMSLGKPVYRFDTGQRVQSTGPFGPAAAPATGETRAKDSTTGGEKCFKPERFEFIPADPMREVARVYGYGATKYADRNWERGYDWGLAYGALQRHLHEFWAGRTTDPESSCHHLAHAVFHCLSLMEWGKTHPELDTRPATKAAPGAGMARP